MSECQTSYDYLNRNNDYISRIQRILEKVKFLNGEQNDSIWEPPMSEENVVEFEKKWKIRLPEDYRCFITTAAAGGQKPFYGLLNPQNATNHLNKPFKLKLNQPIFIFNMDVDEIESFWENEEEAENEVGNGLLTLCTEGCGMYSVLVVNATHPEVYGTVWFQDFANDFGLAPLSNPDTGQVVYFLDWLEYWADKFAGGTNLENFSFSQIVQTPKELANTSKLNID